MALALLLYPPTVHGKDIASKLMKSIRGISIITLDHEL
jgi:hypothetical protein